MANVFVTGGSGFLGRNLIAALVARGDSVVALARSTETADVVRALGAEPAMGDLDDVAGLVKAMHDSDVVYHAAAQVGDWGRFEDFFRVSVGGTQRVIEAMRREGVPKLVHVSTEALLTGDGVPIVNATETRPRSVRPVGVYAVTKAMAEAVVEAANGPDLTTVIVRPRFIWGQGDTTLLPRLVSAVRAGRFMWFSGGHYLTSTCHVANVCEGMIAAAEHGRGGEIYFLTDGAPVEFRSFITAMLATQGVDPGSKSLPRVVAQMAATLTEVVWRVFRRSGEPPLTRSAVALIGEAVTVDDSKARRELGYVGTMTVEAGLAGMRGGSRR